MKSRAQLVTAFVIGFAVWASFFFFSHVRAGSPNDCRGETMRWNSPSACGGGGGGPVGPTLPPAPTSPPATPGGPGNPPPATPSGPPSCSAPRVFPGEITVSGLKLAPAYPLVIGQDDTKRGVDARWTLRIEPTVYVTWTAVPQYDRECGSLGGGAANCTRSNGLPGRFRDVQTGWRCEASTTYYPEGISSANIEASLSQASRDWILTGDLQIRYPGAYLRNPDMTFSGGSGGFSGNVFHFVYEQNRIPFADPGNWELSISGQTSGTAVSPPRSFGGVAGTLGVYLRETAIIR